jgi:hypothetical protein
LSLRPVARPGSLRRALPCARCSSGRRDYLLLLEHPPIHAKTPTSRTCSSTRRRLARVAAGGPAGDVTFQGPGQIVGTRSCRSSSPVRARSRRPRHVTQIETMLVEVLASFGVEATTIDRCPGRRRPHTPADRCDRCAHLAGGPCGFAERRSRSACSLNIVPCGIADKGVTSMAAEGGVKRGRSSTRWSLPQRRWGGGQVERSDVVGVADDDRASLFSRWRRSPCPALRPTRRVGRGVIDAAALWIDRFPSRYRC